MKGKMYLWRGRCIYEGEDVFMKGKMYVWREDVFMKGEQKSWNFKGEDVFIKERCIYEREDVIMKGKMYLWRGRCNYEGEDVFMKGRCIYKGRKKNPGIFKEIKNKMLFKKPRKSLEFLIANIYKFQEFL